MKKDQKMVILNQKELAKNIFEITLKGDLSEYVQTGQFVNIKVNEESYPTLRRPISICNLDKQNNELTLIYRAEGLGTKILSKKSKGEEVDILGPLGTGFDYSLVKENETVVLIGGGVGVPPLYELAKRLFEKGIKVISVLGFASKEFVFYEEEFKKYSQVYICTMDGSLGFNGNVLELIESENIDFDWVFSCGPKPMLKGISDKYSKTKKGYVSLEERMACGIGACYACVCSCQDNKVKRICKDGPVFKLGEILL